MCNLDNHIYNMLILCKHSIFPSLNTCANLPGSGRINQHLQNDKKALQTIFLYDIIITRHSRKLHISCCFSIIKQPIDRRAQGGRLPPRSALQNHHMIDSAIVCAAEHKNPHVLRDK